MIDHIKLKMVIDRGLINNLKIVEGGFKLFNLTFKPTIKYGKLKYHQSNLDNLRLKLKGDELYIENSFWKYSNGWNDSDFTFSSLLKAICNIENKLGISIEEQRLYVLNMD